MKKKFKVLILYCKSFRKTDRNTVDEHLYSFRNYVKYARFYYFNAINGIPKYLILDKYDGVILHYTFLGMRWSKEYFRVWYKNIKNLKFISGYKVAIPQDEYAQTSDLWRIFNENNVKSVFTCFQKEDFDKAYPKNKVQLDHIIHVFPGYIDEKAAQKISHFCNEHNHRAIDIGYRARKVPYWLGKHGQYKYEIGKKFLEILNDSRLRFDISSNDKDVFLGDDWYKFLCKCRVVLGCEGGSSLFDPYGNIRQMVDEYVEQQPEAKFDEVRIKCFPNNDYNINLFALSPRHFECSITKTCQVLLEGDYDGVLLPNIHYIEVKKDFSNLSYVIKKINNVEYCRTIAENAYRDIYQSKKYTYREFANRIIKHIKSNRLPQSEVENNQFISFLVCNYIILREILEPILIKVLTLVLVFKVHRFAVINKALKRILTNISNRLHTRTLQ